jgi:hypothetical protein
MSTAQTQIIESGINVNKPVQLPAWALVALLGGGGGWLTYHEYLGQEPPPATPAPVHHNCAEDLRADMATMKAEVSGLKVQVQQMDARLARIEEALINGKR